MTKQFSLLQLINIVEDRLCTTMDDVYAILNHLCDAELMTHNIPVAMAYVKQKNPNWYQDIQKRIIEVKEFLKTNDFKEIIERIKTFEVENFDIPQLRDEFDTSDFEELMVANSLLLKE